jgi:hypothetical protein
MKFDANKIEISQDATSKAPEYLLKDKERLLREYDSIKGLKEDVERAGFAHLEKIYQRRMDAINSRLNNFLKLSQNELVATLTERCEVLDLLSLRKFVTDKEIAISERLMEIEGRLAYTLGKE